MNGIIITRHGEKASFFIDSRRVLGYILSRKCAEWREERVNLIAFTYILQCAYRLYSATLFFSCTGAAAPIPSPGGKVPPQGADEERRQPLAWNAVNSECTALQIVPSFRTAFIIATFRQSSSDLAGARPPSPRGKVLIR